MIRRPRDVLILTLLAFAGLASSARAQSYGTELPFVLGTGARPSGMGVAGFSLADDATVQHYNPSGLGYLQWKEAILYRTSLFDSKSVYYALSYAHPTLSQGTWAISLMRVDTGGIEQRDVNNQLLSTDLENTQTRILLGYARRVTQSIAAGVNLKLDNQSFGDYSGSGLGLDAGLMATQQFSGNSFVTGLREGFVVQNLIEPSVKLDRDDVSDPMSMGLGVSALSGFGEVRLVTSLDLVSPRYSPFDFRFGQEVVYRDYFALRFGFDDVTPTFGFGAQYKQISLDYAYRSEDLGNNHRISLSVKFGASVPEQRARAREALENEVNAKLAARMAEMEGAHIAANLQQADSLFAARDFARAAERYELILVWDPTNERAKARLPESKYRLALGMAETAVAREKYVEGVFYANRALVYAPDDSAASALAAVCNEQMHAAQQNQEILENLLRASIDLYADRRFGEALSGFEEALRIAPDNRLASEYVEKCRVSVDEAVRGHRAEAASRAKRGDYDGAISALESALEYRPRDAALLKDLGTYTKQRDEANVASVEPVSGNASPRPQTARRSAADDKMLDEHYRKGMAAFNAGNFQEAIGSFLKVWTAQPDYYSVSELLTKAYLFVGMSFYSDNKYAEAIEAWQRALAVDPTNSKAKRYLSKAQEELQRLSRVNDGK